MCLAADEVLDHAVVGLAELLAAPVELGGQLPQLASGRRGFLVSLGGGGVLLRE